MSKQKTVVYNAVMSSSDHPTADMVLSRCKEVMPSINLATVYRNLNALIKEGVQDGDTVVVYDIEFDFVS